MQKPTKFLLLKTELYLPSDKNFSFKDLKSHMPKDVLLKDLIFETVYVGCNCCDEYCFHAGFNGIRVFYNKKIINKKYDKELLKYKKSKRK